MCQGGGTAKRHSTDACTHYPKPIEARPSHVVYNGDQKRERGRGRQGRGRHGGQAPPLTQQALVYLTRGYQGVGKQTTEQDLKAPPVPTRLLQISHKSSGPEHLRQPTKDHVWNRAYEPIIREGARDA